MTYPSFEAALAASHTALIAMANADPQPSLALWSHSDDAVLANPLGAPKRGIAAITPEVRRVAAMFGGAAGPLEFEEVSRIVSPDLGVVIGIERMAVRRVGSDDVIQNALRVTTVFQREDDGWRLVLRHADRVTA
ncbi:YybH family protein [Sandarakinorhabdus rubra]|uniref:YybH family protein n=1 Tax=Sandarakinorhabdus rubra TaxID=2672568 RepID=UPI0013DBF49F|nr:nuclear transport factor 2 family protein [Sandarakinorhabdus rubra]